MAKKPKPPKAPAQTQNQKDIAQLLEDVNAGKGVANDLGVGGSGFLGRVDESLPTFAADPNIMNQGELLARLRAESYIGGTNSPEQTRALQGLSDLADSAGNRTADTADVIARRRQMMADSGVTDPALLDTASRLQSEADRARSVSPDVQLALDRARAGLGGLTSEEAQAFLESATDDTNRAFSGGLRDLAGAGALSGAGMNSALMSQLVDNYSRAQLGARNDLAVKNIGIQDQRLGAFSNLAQSVDDTGYARAQDTLKNLGDFRSYLDKLRYDRGVDTTNLFEQSVAGAENDEFNRGMAAKSQYAGAVEANEQNNRADRMDRLKNYQDELFRTRQDNFQRATTNLNTNAAEISTRLGVTLGVPEYLQSVRTDRNATDVAKAQIKAAGGSTEGIGAKSAPISGATPLGLDGTQQNTSSATGMPL